jgi:hypothetical protein
VTVTDDDPALADLTKLQKESSNLNTMELLEEIEEAKHSSIKGGRTIKAKDKS